MKRFIRSIPGKTTLFIVTLLSLALTAGCFAGGVFMVECDFYTTPKEELIQDALYGRVEGKAYNLVNMAAYKHEYESDLYESSAEGTSLRYGIYTESDELVAQTEGFDFRKGVPNAAYGIKFYVNADPSDRTVIASDRGTLGTAYNGDLAESIALSGEELDEIQREGMKPYFFYAYVDTSAANDEFSFIASVVGLLYALRYGIVIIGVVAVILAIACFVTLMCVSGRRPDTDKLVPGPLNRVPIDLLLLAGIGISGCLMLIVTQNYFVEWGILLALFLVAAVASASIFLGLCMSIACRIKQRNLLKNTVTWRACKLCWRFLKWTGRGCKRFGRWFLRASRQLPMIWRTCLAFLALCLLELIFIAGWWYSAAGYLFFWFVEHIFLAAVIFFGALTLRRLQRAGEALAEGDLSYQVDTSRMYWDFKKHGQNLNSIAGGMTHAVEQRLKSERMKTELITNVSHDIKTPLTSIINYADLIGKEPCDNPKIGEYAEVLGRQSDRLKRLIEDLVEASKASTGNLEVLLAPCEAENFIVQISGEYAQKLSNAGLELVTKTPEESLRVMADGRRMLRVFDNLMNNICKYAQRGTRVYLTLEEKDLMAVITFRNTSSAPLNLTPEELMERFVQGDASRSSDGNGLGLSIARSLTELQKGDFQLDVDGDLFKVTLRFPLLPEDG